MCPFYSMHSCLCQVKVPFVDKVVGDVLIAVDDAHYRLILHPEWAQDLHIYNILQGILDLQII